MASLEDFETLLTRVAQGDRTAFFSLFDITAPKLHGMCLAILDDPDWADEVLEVAFARIWNDAPKLATTGLTALTWVLSIARETAVEARRAASGDDTHDPLELQTITPSQNVSSAGDGPVPLLRRALGWLPQDRRDALLLSYFSGIRYKELAARYRVPYATMRNWHRRSLVRLYADLTGKQADEDVLMAGEYVLDVIPVPEQAQFQERLRSEEGLQNLIAGWTEDFITLTDSIAAVPPRADLKARLDRVIFPHQRGSLFQRLSVAQTIVWVAAAVSVGFLISSYIPGAQDIWQRDAVPPQQNIAPLEQPVTALELPADGPLLAQFDPLSGQLVFGGDKAPLEKTTNLTVYLDFGDNTEWISLGTWPTIAPHKLGVAQELHPIIKGAQVVILGGAGSDQEVLRLTVQ